MTPDTVHRLAQEIRYMRGVLAKDEEWARLQPDSETRTQLFQINEFWRAVLKFGEDRLSRS